MHSLTQVQVHILRDVLGRHGVTEAKVFGSSARGQATASSDIDLVAVFPPAMSLWDIIAVKLELEAALQKRVDLVELAGLPPKMAERISREAQAL